MVGDDGGGGLDAGGVTLVNGSRGDAQRIGLGYEVILDLVLDVILGELEYGEEVLGIAKLWYRCIGRVDTHCQALRNLRSGHGHDAEVDLRRREGGGEDAILLPEHH